MERTIRTKRIYSLEPYNTFTAEDEVTAIPEDLMFDNEYIKKVKFLQRLEVELQYYTYLEFEKKLKLLPPNERLTWLKDTKGTVTEELYKYIFDRATK